MARSTTAVRLHALASAIFSRRSRTSGLARTLIHLNGVFLVMLTPDRLSDSVALTVSHLNVDSVAHLAYAYDTSQQSTEDKMNIDGIEYVPARTELEEMRITIVDRSGLTFVGRVNIYEDAEILTIKDARCVIRWGTGKHLAQLVNGPTGDTRLGCMADVQVLKRNLVASYLVEGGWS